jgi:hypothetical protein
MERNGSIPTAWDGSDPVFGTEKIEEQNGSVFCSVQESHRGTERHKYDFICPNQN